MFNANFINSSPIRTVYRRFNYKFPRISIRNAVLVGFLALLTRKIMQGYTAMQFVKSCRDEVSIEKMLSNADFKRALSELSTQETTLVLILNQHALNITLNWLCNTRNMPDVHESALIVTLDEQSDTQLAKVWPKIRRISWIVPCLKDPFNYGDGKYQLLYLFRANLVNALLTLGKPFWMIQQDTFWRRSLLTLDLHNFTSTYNTDVIFDRGANNEVPLIAGGYFSIQPTDGARKYFAKLAKFLEWWYVPDNCLMTALCAEEDYQCSYLPFNVVTNWIWLYERSNFANKINESTNPPIMLQFDGDMKLGGKLGKMKSLGFYFLKSDGFSCDESAVKSASDIIENHHGNSHIDSKAIFAEKLNEWRSYSHWQFNIYQNIVALMYKTQFTESLLNILFLPYAHYLMITL